MKTALAHALARTTEQNKSAHSLMSEKLHLRSWRAENTHAACCPFHLTGKEHDMCNRATD